VKLLTISFGEGLGQINAECVKCYGWDGATNDVGAPQNRINVLTPRDNDILTGFWTGGHRPPLFQEN
jgi:hypothetical protein